MKPHCCFDNPAVPFVVDASVAINLNATGHASEVIKAFPNNFVMVDIAHGELLDGCRKGRNDGELINTLVESGHLTLVQLGEVGQDHFECLVVGDGADTLDDGEAATIAFAVQATATAFIDERKANRICAERFEYLTVASTMDLLMHPKLREVLGKDAVSDMIFNALQCARMNVPMCHLDGMLDLIGRERAARCMSLPKTIRDECLTLSSHLENRCDS